MPFWANTNETYPEQSQDEASPGTRPSGPPTARDRSERWILGVLLVEPQRWFDVQKNVHVSDFTDEPRRKLAEIYWQHHQDEGEPKPHPAADR